MSPLDSNNPQGIVVQKPKPDIYTTMLVLSLVAILIAIFCLFLEMRAYDMDISAAGARVGAMLSVEDLGMPVPLTAEA